VFVWQHLHKQKTKILDQRPDLTSSFPLTFSQPTKGNLKFIMINHPVIYL